MIPAMIALVKLSHNALTKMLLFILILLDDTTPLRWIAALALLHTQQGAAAHNQSITLLTQMNRKSQHFSHGIQTMRQRSRCNLNRELVAGQMRRLFFTVTP
jgi:hypothetical protein